MSDELKPCPFCGGKPRVIRAEGMYAAVACTSCGADATLRSLDDWNARAQDDHPVEEPADPDAEAHTQVLQCPGCAAWLEVKPGWVRQLANGVVQWVDVPGAGDPPRK